MTIDGAEIGKGRRDFKELNPVNAKLKRTQKE
jgi:hypothetical protein